MQHPIPLDTNVQITPVEIASSAIGVRLSAFGREALAMLFWVYVILKLFVYDFDAYLVTEYFPEEVWLLKFRLVILIGVIAVALLIFGKNRVGAWSLYIIAYPLIITFWKLPYFIYNRESWTLAFAIINSVLSFYRSLRYNVAVSAVCLTSLVIIFTSSNPTFLWIAATVLLGLLLLTYLNRFVVVFRPTGLFQLYTKAISVGRTQMESTYRLDENLRNLPVQRLTDEQLKKWTPKLEAAVLWNRLCLFMAKRLQDYHDSGLNFVSGVITMLALLLATVFSFAAINLALFKIEAANFETTGQPSFFTFFYYSFQTLLFNSIKEIAPATPISQTVSMIENLFAFILGAVLFALVLSVRSQRYSEEMKKIVAGIELEGERIESLIKDEYRIGSIEEAMAELQRLKAGLVQLLDFLTRNLR
jgi:hypothetical protein